MTISISRRLTLLIGSLSALVFGVVGALLYVSLDRELARRETEDLSGKIGFVKHLLDEVPSLAAIQTSRHHLDDMVASHGNLRVWVATTDRRTLVYGSGPPPVTAASPGGPFSFSLDDGTPMRALAARIPAQGVKPPLDILIAADVHATEHVLTNFAVALSVLWLAGLTSMVLLGAWVARRGLAPVQALSRQAHALGPSTLSQRLPERDIPVELLDLAQSFNRVLDRLEQAYRQLEAFNADVAHELRTPLLNLSGSTEVALSRDRTIDELREILVSNLEELERLKSIVNDMLFLARADQGERATAQYVALDSVARDVAEIFEPLLEERRISLVIHGTASAAGDAGLLRRAVTNLVSNALAYTEAGRTIRIEMAADNDAVSLRTCNPGPAISQEHLSHIFDRFYRVDPARSAHPQGHGLGLAIVKAIVRMHGGGVFASSRDGVTEVGFRLPRAAPDVTPQPAAVR